ncbi:MAG: hypothetical protein HFJ17_01565 [Clostridia bacterium]|nr:hypothetical protein [Clostridia bacterium]
MNPEITEKMYKILKAIPVTKGNREKLEKIKELLDNDEVEMAIYEIKKLQDLKEETDDELIEDKYLIEEGQIYPKALMNQELEEQYMGLLLNDPKSISMYYFVFEENYIADEGILNLYKSVLFTEGDAYASEIAKRNYNFSKDTQESYQLKLDLKVKVKDQNLDFEKIYVELKKLFILRKNYLEVPIKNIQNKIVDIVDYELYDQMSIEEVESAVMQAQVTAKFKQAILNEDMTSFLTAGDNNLANGLKLPFSILSSVFKGIRRGETTAFAMPSNSGKSRFTINLAAYIAFVHKKKVLVISNEMSEEKMKLCLMTTIINNPEIQKLHGQKLKITEGELLELKFKPDDKKEVEVDANGYIVRDKDESQSKYITKLKKYSSDFNKTLKAMEWLSGQVNNAIQFINITDHTNDELNKVIKNYYYKDQIQYVFYDTLKTDTEHIGNGEEVKKTATILSNLAQNFNIFIGSTLQLTESKTLPVNLDVNDLSASRTVKEVLDTLCLIKQIPRDTLDQYEYSLKEVDTEFFDLKKYDDPDVRYYACVVDKNRAGAKPKVVFKLNLAYNSWEELGYLKLKQEDQITD